jgi:hypothetical protein
VLTSLAGIIRTFRTETRLDPKFQLTTLKWNNFPQQWMSAAADRDLLTLSAKTRILQLRTQQIDHRLGWGATKAMGDLSGVISMALKLY